MPRSQFRLLFAGLALAVTLPGCDIKVDGDNVSLGVSRGRASDDWVRSYTLPKGGRFEVANENGEIAVKGTEGTEVKVTAHREVTTGSDEESKKRLESLKMREDVSADRVFIEAVTGSMKDVGFTRGLSVRYDIEVPDGLTVSVKTMNGTVRLDNVDGKITAATTNGNVTGNAITGAVQGSSVNGSVAMNLDEVKGDVNLLTVNGAVRMEMPPTADAELQATTVNGGVSVDDKLAFADVEKRSNFGPPTSFRGRLNKGGPRVTLQTTNGPVRVSVRGSGDNDDDDRGRGRGRRGGRGREVEGLRGF
jgi:DUF4097 and DUF4098 domain-containing protein YvlB